MLGAAMFMVEIAGMRALYTGDYSRLADRHMSAADLPAPPPHIGARHCFHFFSARDEQFPVCSCTRRHGASSMCRMRVDV